MNIIRQDFSSSLEPPLHEERKQRSKVLDEINVMITAEAKKSSWRDYRFKIQKSMILYGDYIPSYVQSSLNVAQAHIYTTVCFRHKNTETESGCLDMQWKQTT